MIILNFKTIQVLDDSELIYVQRIIGFGINDAMARIIVALTINGETKFRDLGYIAELPASQVSVASNKLQKLGIVTIKPASDNGLWSVNLKGDPVELIKLNAERYLSVNGKLFKSARLSCHKYTKH